MSKFINKLLKICGLITLVEHEQEINDKNRELIELKKQLFAKEAEICVAEAEVERFQYICGRHHMQLKNQKRQLRLAEQVLETFNVGNRR